MAPAIKEYVGEQIAPFDARIKELEQRLRDTENKSVSCRGVWQQGQSYGRNSAVVRQGSLWVALRPTCGTPGGPMK